MKFKDGFKWWVLFFVVTPFIESSGPTLREILGLSDRTAHIIWAVGWVFCVAFVWWFGREFLKIRVVKNAEAVAPHKMLVVFLSTTKLLPEHCDKLEYDIVKDTEGRIDGFSWQQLLRAIVPHLGCLERLCIVPSTGKNGSEGQVEACRAWLKKYPRLGGVAIDAWEALDFEDIDGMLGSLKSHMIALKKNGFDYADVILDCTGGQKTTSIAATMLTTELEEMEFQYVGTGEPYRVVSFNIQSVQRPTL